MDKKFYGLIIPKKVNKVEQKSKSIFDSDEESENSTSLTKKTGVFDFSSKSLAKNISLQKKLEKDDPTIYEYDNIYDTLKSTKTEKQKSVKKEGPKYINNLLKAAEKRKNEQERRQERKIQTEREKEGNEFEDKEAFVTSAYKKKMIEMQEEEEREKLQDQIDEMMDVTKQKDLSGFYRHYLKQTVGEEKIPEFGERESKIKELSNRIKKEQDVVPNESIVQDNSNRIKKEQDVVPNESIVQDNVDIKKYENLDADYSSDESSDDGGNTTSKGKNSKSVSYSDSDSSSDTSVKYSERKSESNKSTNKPTSKYESNDSSDKEASEKVNRKYSKSYKKTQMHDKSLSDSENDDTKKQTIDKKRAADFDDHSQKKRRQDAKVSNVEGDSLNKTVPANNHDTREQHIDNKDIEIEKSKPKIDIRFIFVKRTVGEIFDNAQARYFKRMALRNSS